MKVIKALYGEYEGVFGGVVVNSGSSPWHRFLASYKRLEDQCVMSKMVPKKHVGNGARMRF